MPEKEYIEREAIEKAFAKEIHTNYLDDYAKGFQAALLAVMSIPTAKVSPVRHGYWVKEKRDVLIHWHCSACKECFYLDKPNAEYCPHCGAKMDEKERDEND